MLVSGFHSRRGKCLVPKFKGGWGAGGGQPHIKYGGSQLITDKSIPKGGGVKAPPDPPEINLALLLCPFTGEMSDGWPIIAC